MRVPGAPEYLKYMREQQDRVWRTVEHKTHGEYQSLMPDLVLESEYLGHPSPDRPGQDDTA